MNWRAPAIFALLGLAAAAAPPTDCGPPSTLNAAGGTLSASQDLAGRPVPTPDLGTQTYATLPSRPDAGDCQNPLSAVSHAAGPQDGEDEIMHGLPAPEILRPMNETKKSPYLQ